MGIEVKLFANLPNSNKSPSSYLLSNKNLHVKRNSGHCQTLKITDVQDFWLKYWTLNDFRMIKVACVIFTQEWFSRKEKLLYLDLVHRKTISVSFRTCNMLMFIKRLLNWSHVVMVTVSGWYTLSPTLHGCVLRIIVYSLYFVISRMTHMRWRPILKRNRPGNWRHTNALKLRQGWYIAMQKSRAPS